MTSIAALTVTAMLDGAAHSADCNDWPDWKAFKKRFIQADGRVIDYSAQSQSTSEGQAYALFFALVANDRSTFDSVLGWTSANLAQGDLSARLMAWKWGKRSDGGWGVVDTNAASDAELWFSYVLFQASRRWSSKALRAMAELMQARIEIELVKTVAGVGPVLIPGPQGYQLTTGGWKLNPSYLPLPVLRGLASEVPSGPWSLLASTTLAMLEAVTPQLLVPDWIVVRPDSGFALDAEAGFDGGHEAIRTYLWTAMLSDRDPDRSRLLARMTGMAALLDQLLVPPARVDAFSGRSEGSGPIGFSVALLPYLEAVGAKASAERQRLRITAAGGVPSVYYEQALGLFAQGWMDQRFRFAPDGRLDWGVPAKCNK